MAEQAVTRPSSSQVAGGSAQHAVHHGRTASWIVVSIIILGFVVGGAALPAGPTWWLFWLGVALVVVGCIGGAAARVLDDWY